MASIENDEWLIETLCDGLKYKNIARSTALNEAVNAHLHRPLVGIIEQYAGREDPCMLRDVMSLEAVGRCKKVRVTVRTPSHTRVSKLRVEWSIGHMCYIDIVSKISDFDDTSMVRVDEGCSSTANVLYGLLVDSDADMEPMVTIGMVNESYHDLPGTEADREISLRAAIEQLLDHVRKQVVCTCGR